MNVKGLEPALRAEAEAVGAAAWTTLAARDPASPLARSVQIVDLSQGDKPAFARGQSERPSVSHKQRSPGHRSDQGSQPKGWSQVDHHGHDDTSQAARPI